MKDLVCCSCLAALVLWFSPVHAHESITLCSTDTPPLAIQTSDSPYDVEGLAIDIVNEVARRSDLNIRLMALPFKRCLQYTKQGTLDGCFMTIKNAEREAYADFTESYLSILTYFYYSPERMGRFEWNAWEELGEYEIGTQRGFKYGQLFTDASQQVPLKLVETPSIIAGIEMVLSGRIDLVLINEFRYRHLMATHPEYRGKLAQAQKPVGTGFVYIALSKKSPNAALVGRLNETLAEMKATGAIEKIARHWLKPTPDDTEK